MVELHSSKDHDDENITVLKPRHSKSVSKNVYTKGFSGVRSDKVAEIFQR